MSLLRGGHRDRQAPKGKKLFHGILTIQAYSSWALAGRSAGEVELTILLPQTPKPFAVQTLNPENPNSPDTHLTHALKQCTSCAAAVRKAEAPRVL